MQDILFLFFLHYKLLQIIFYRNHALFLIIPKLSSRSIEKLYLLDDKF